MATPPNNGDSLTYHLTRAAAWLEHGGLHRIPGPEKTPENDYPPNAEIEILFSFAFLRGDGAAALPQFSRRWRRCSRSSGAPGGWGSHVRRRSSLRCSRRR